MSDAIREAFEALERVGNYVSVPFEMMVQFADDLDTVKAALQSQTAPAVPEGWKLVPVEPTPEQKKASLDWNDTYHTGGLPVDMNRNIYRAMLNAAPQPNHSTDAGKVVQGKNRYGLDMGYFARLITREFGDLRNFRPDEFARVCARMAATADASVLQEKEFHATPSVPEEEVQAQALEALADRLDKEDDDFTDEHGYGKSMMDATDAMREEAARLRASQQEDRGSEFAAFISRGLRDTAGDDGEGV